MDKFIRYKELCDTEPTIPIYSTYWWLNAVCGEGNWDVLLHENGGRIIAAWPIYIKKRLGFKLITQPQITPILGIWIKQDPEWSTHVRIGHEIDICNRLMEQLPPHDFFIQNFNYNFTNWLPFYWKKYKQRTRYSYIIKDIKNDEEILNRFTPERRRQIKKARELVTISPDLPEDEFYFFLKTVLQKLGKKVSYPFDLFSRLHGAVYAHNAGRTICAKDKEGNIHSALFIAWDKQAAYGIISAIDRDFGNSGASDLLAFEALKMASNHVDIFDFEGSMIKSVEHANRRAGGTQTPFFEISRTPSKILSLGLFLFKDLYLRNKRLF